MNYSKMVIKTYNKIADQYNAEFGDNCENVEEIDTFLNSLPGNKVIDMACGVGQITEFIRSRGYYVLGIDKSKTMIKIARTKFPNCEFKNADITNPKLKQKYDGILLSYCLFHLTKKQVEQVLPIYNNMLNASGKMLLIIQEGDGEKIISEPFNPKLKIFINYYRETEIIDLLKNNGFQTIKIEKKQKLNENELGSNILFLFCEKK